MASRQAGVPVPLALLLVSVFAFGALLLFEEQRLADARSMLSARDASLSERDSEIALMNSSLASCGSALRGRDGRIAMLESNLSALSEKLSASEADASRLEGELARTRSELEEAQTTLEEAEAEIGEIRAETEAMGESVNESIQWFKDNSALERTLKIDRFLSKVERGCVDEGTLNLACASLLMEQELGFSYKDDPGGDRLYSLDEIVARKGGDCEDYSLFMKALLARMAGGGPELEAYTSGLGRYEVYRDESSGTLWYLDNARGRNVGKLGESKPYAACYYYDVGEEVRSGHCIIMLAGSEINSSAAITADGLGPAQFFEPQTGEYMGALGSEFSVCENGDEGCEDRPYSIVFIITEDDLYHFEGGRWAYYHDYLVRTEEILRTLESIDTGA